MRPLPLSISETLRRRRHLRPYPLFTFPAPTSSPPPSISSLRSHCFLLSFFHHLLPTSRFQNPNLIHPLRLFPNHHHKTQTTPKFFGSPGVYLMAPALSRSLGDSSVAVLRPSSDLPKAAKVMPFVESDLSKIAEAIVEKVC